MDTMVNADGALPLKIAAPDADEMQKKGELLIIDIRSPGEWRMTGVAKDAKAITVHSNKFINNLLAAMDNNKAHPVGLICATGNRTAQVQSFLLQRGFSAITDISEGMLGNSSGPGWILRGLPVETYTG
jgi:rhodanese-related sulfurtransferase